MFSRGLCRARREWLHEVSKEKEPVKIAIINHFMMMKLLPAGKLCAKVF
jgi:hypothetical protein